MTKVALFGGSFDPPHLGHQLVTSYLLGCHENFDSVALIPTAKHAMGKNLIDFTHRRRMVEKMIEVFNPSRVEVSTAENWLITHGGYKDSRTITLVRHFVNVNPDLEFHLVIGSDLITQATQWDDWDEIQKLVKIFIVGRLGYGSGQVGYYEKLVLPNISSTEIRKDIDSMKHHLPHDVYQYIKMHKLYGSKGNE
jgi:nicotinate-nucleotide adenylyltransferase